MTSNIITANLDAVEAHFHSEAANAVDEAIAMYTEDIVWEAPARGLQFQGKEEVAKHYRQIFSSIEDVEFRNLQRFATEDRVVDDSVLTFTLTRRGFCPFRWVRRWRCAWPTFSRCATVK